jgi:hypothetical protein
VSLHEETENAVIAKKIKYNFFIIKIYFRRDAKVLKFQRDLYF